MSPVQVPKRLGKCPYTQVANTEYEYTAGISGEERHSVQM